MVTGYTSEIQDGETFEAFAMKCARNFGACIDMRDEQLSAEINLVVEPSQYHKKAIVTAEVLLKDAKRMTLEEAGRRAQHDVDKANADHETSRMRCIELNNIYTKMLGNIHDWEPPTEEHEGLKKFMREQVVITMEDCKVYPIDVELQSATEWRRDNMDRCAETLGHHLTEWEKEKYSCEDKTKWITDLHESLFGVD